MEDLQELQDLQNQKIEQLKEKLKEINKVSFNEYESESIDSPVEKKKIRKSRRKKIDLSDEEQETKIEKPIRE